jgi:hypothetical protein
MNVFISLSLDVNLSPIFRLNERYRRSARGRKEDKSEKSKRRVPINITAGYVILFIVRMSPADADCSHTGKKGKERDREEERKRGREEERKRGRERERESEEE